ncbi:sugar phosphate isomerase/epimerase family protein [Propionispora vibrioides]|uniref:Sugar phosphate isomerase/epimerase n=1 Tax=Propionispora vibrioides TaxID=112903 RepID=A0A1H8XQK8_9FIRM|nr:sugar phosphate isomerase/epimerase [Propionispora vibrioides]SEP42043.1 Sugar phosphate isomerase/epimerase [Propionispora vibrioides]
MKYSFNTWAYSSFPCWVPAYPLKDTIERLARIGYDAIELGCASPHAWPYFLDAAKRKEINKWLKDSNIVFSSLLPAPGGGPGANIASAMKEEREWSVQYVKDVIDMADDFNCHTVLIVCGWYIYGTKQEEAWKYSRESIRNIAEYARRKGTRLCLEPTPTDSNLVETADDALIMKDQVGMDNVFVMFDTAHALYRNEPPTDYIYRMGNDLKHVHLTDYDRKAPGTGGCDFVAIMQALKDVDYAGYVTMETGFPTRGIHPDSCARISLENLKAIEGTLK